MIFMTMTFKLFFITTTRLEGSDFMASSSRCYKSAVLSSNTLARTYPSRDVAMEDALASANCKQSFKRHTRSINSIKDNIR
jgi:hypothetical protein